MICKLCPHKCAAYKNTNTIGGKCGVSANIKVARIAPHFWEEPCISGEKGSGAVFFSGCTMKCIYCQNSEISADLQGVEISPEILADEYRKLEELGVHNIDLISATQFLPEILKSFEIYKPHIPIVYNCGGYERTETLRALEGIVDIYLPDFKYSDNNLAKEYSGAEDYPQVALEALKEMFRQTGRLTVNDDGIAEKGVLVRHLVLPNHTKNSIGVLNILKENFGDNLTLSLMGQYTPHGRALNHPKLNRKITKREYQKVLDHLIDLDIDGFAQELQSADESFIPLWDYKN
ncbi:MAG: radical SAM protein [Ruminococcus sp.]|nr:radical SAM protein [Ruminococcus sp.]